MESCVSNFARHVIRKISKGDYKYVRYACICMRVCMHMRVYCTRNFNRTTNCVFVWLRNKASSFIDTPGISRDIANPTICKQSIVVLKMIEGGRLKEANYTNDSIINLKSFVCLYAVK